MLTINPLLICNLIAKAKAFHAREVADVDEDSSNPSDDMIKDVLAIEDEEKNDDPLYDEMKLAIEELDPDQQAELIAIMWIGREDFIVDDWFAALDEAKRCLTPTTAEYLLSKPQVANYLEDGLNKLGYYCNGG